MSVDAVVFDLDGVLLDSEVAWNEAKRELTETQGGRWSEDAPRDMMGMSSPEWSRYLNQELGVPIDPEEINRAVVDRLAERYRKRLPLLPGAREAVERLAERWPLGLASSSNRPIIDLVLETSGLAPCFEIALSSEEVERGKPAPDVYLAAARALGADPAATVAIEDSTNGIRAARAAGMRVIALPNRDFPPEDAALAQAGVVIESLDELTPELVEGRPGG